MGKHFNQWASLLMNRHFPLGDINPIKYFYFVSSITGLLFALVAPNEKLPFLLHLLVWQLQAFIPISTIIISHILLSKSETFTRLAYWQQLLLSGLFGSIVFSPLALLIDIYIVGEGFPNSLLFELLDEAAAVTPPVTIFWLLINLPWILGFEYQQKHNERSKQIQSDFVSTSSKHPLPAFLSSTNINNVNEVVSLSAQLHYLEICTDNNKYLILYSLAKAIEELPKSIGIQIHRSHWVGFEHVNGINKVGRQGEVVLSNGNKLPISRAKLNDVVAMFEQHTKYD